MIKGLRKQAEESFAIVPGFQADRGKEKIRQTLMEDLFKIKLFGGCVVAFAALVYVITDSAHWYFAAGMLGVVALHIAAFAWARPYLQSGTRPRAKARPANDTPMPDPVFAD